MSESIEPTKNVNAVSVESVVKRLSQIAEINEDRFRFAIEIEPQRVGVWYRFVAIECADGHEFVFGGGDTIEEAIVNTMEDIGKACEDWGYQDVEQ
jgi:hypothetical protein